MPAERRYYSTIEDAHQLVRFAFAGMVDKQGAPYYGHCARVGDYARLLGGDADQIRAGILHDVVEDTAITLGMLMGLGFPGRVIDLVDAVTRRRRETHDDYYQRILADGPSAVLVKTADIADNLDWRRLSKIPDPVTQHRLYAKGLHACEMLGVSEARLRALQAERMYGIKVHT